MASPKQFKTAIVITGNADGAIKVTKATERELGKLENRGKSVSAQLSNIAGTGIKYGAALAGAAAAGAAVMIKRQLDIIDSTAKVSDKLGIATEKLTALRLQAELTGAGSKTLDMGLQRMTRRVAEAARGTGEAQEAIKQLGLDATELAKLAPDQQFAAIADAMEGVSSQGERVRLSFKLFDSEGVALVNTLRGGSAAALEAQQFTEQWGLALNRVDASKIEQANDAIALASRASEGFWKQLTVKVSPAITGMAKDILGFGAEFGNAESMADKAFNAIATGAGFVADIGRGLNVIWKGVTLSVAEWFAQTWEAVAGVDSLLTNLLNKLPKWAGGGSFQESELIQGVAGSLRNVATDMGVEFAELLIEKMPSQKIKEKLAEWEAEATAAGEVVAASNKKVSTSYEDVGDAAGKAAEKAKKAAEKALKEEEKRRKALANKVDAFLSDGFDSKAFEAFDQLGKSMYGVVDALNEMVDRQAAFNELKAAEGITAEQVAKINARQAQNQISAYGDITGAAKGYFSEGSKGYEALQAAEKTFRLFEIAMAGKALAAKMASLAVQKTETIGTYALMSGAAFTQAQAEGLATVAGAGKGLPAPLAIAAMASVAAALASFGVSIGGGSGGSAPKGALDNKAYSGLATSGTVLGDPDEASESLLNALGKIEGVEDLQLNYAKSMAASLNNIEKAMGGVAAGFASAAALRGAQSLKFSGTVGNVESEFGTRLNFRPFSTVTAETTQKELEQMFLPFILDDYAGRMRKAQDLIADLKEAGIDPATQSALQRVQNDMNKTFDAMGESLATAVNALGGDAQAAVDKFVSTTIDIDLREQEDIDEAVNQLFSSIADSAVAAANMQLSGVDLTQFQQVGEGLFETLTRVSGQVVSFKEAADALGISLSTEAGALSQGISKAIDRVLGRNTEGRSYTRDFSGAQLAEISDQLVGAAGGLSEFTGNVSDLIDVLLDDDQKFERNRSQLTTLFAGLNASLPTSAEALSQYISGLDLSKTAHQKAFTAVSASSGAIGDFFDQLEDYADAAYNFDTALGIADGSRPLREALAQVGLNLDIVETAAAGGSVALQALFVDLTDTQKAGLEPFADAITALLPESQLASAGLDGVAASLGRLGSASQGISNYLESLGYSEAAGTPEQRLAAARSQFASQVELALRGDEAAAGKLTGLADTVLSLGGEVYASGAQFQDLSSGVTSALAGVASAIDIQTPIEQQLGLLAEIRDAVAASPQGTAQFIEQRLAGYFEAIDANTDAMLTIGELSTALGDIASDDLLAEVVSTLDTNRDGTISRLEALIGATVGVESAVREIEPGSAESVIGALPVIPSIEELRAMRDRSASQRVRDSFRRIGDRLGFASGGYVSGPGTPTSDSIPAQLSNGEFVMQASAVNQYGPAFFDSLNTGRRELFDDRRMVEAIATLNREVEHQTRLNAEAARQTVAELKRLNRRVADIEAELETARVVS